MPTLAIDDRMLSYEDSGDGPVALLIHGSPGNANAWARVAKLLAKRFRVIAPDLPGYGETTPQVPGQEPDVGYASELIEALIRHVGPPAVLAGHSYGGVVALSVALRRKVEIGAVVLFEPVAMPILAMAGDAQAFADVRAVFDDYIASFEGGDGRAVRKMIDHWFGAGAFAAMPETLQTYLIRETASNIKDVRGTFRERYSADAFRGLSVPVVVVVGDRSPDVTHRIARRVAEQLPRGSVEILAGANHALTTTHAEAVAGFVSSAAQ
jgi:pimeloyl-ACP methyl ester carboxylesterase